MGEGKPPKSNGVFEKYKARKMKERVEVPGMLPLEISTGRSDFGLDRDDSMGSGSRRCLAPPRTTYITANITPVISKISNLVGTDTANIMAISKIFNIVGTDTAISSLHVFPYTASSLVPSCTNDKSFLSPLSRDNLPLIHTTTLFEQQDNGNALSLRGVSLFNNKHLLCSSPLLNHDLSNHTNQIGGISNNNRKPRSFSDLDTNEDDIMASNGGSRCLGTGSWADAERKVKKRELGVVPISSFSQIAAKKAAIGSSSVAPIPAGSSPSNLLWV